MSMAIVIKNTLLLVLIILIGHFMIKNVLVDKKGVSKSSLPAIPAATPNKTNDLLNNNICVEQPKQEMQQNTNKQHVIGNNAEVLPEIHAPIPSQDALPKIEGGLDKAKEELLKFIDDEDEDEGVMEKYFESKNSHVPSDNCKPKEIDNRFPLSTTCDPNLQKLPGTDKTIKANCNLNQDKRNVMIVKEYENENSMNGGELYGGLHAYDSFDHSFQELV